MITNIIEFLFDLVLCEIDTVLIFELLNRSYGKIKNQRKLVYLSATIITLFITIYFHYIENYSNIFCNMIIYFSIIGFYPSNFKRKFLFSMSLLSLNASALLILNDITNIFPKGWIVFGLLCYHISFWSIIYFSMKFNNSLYVEIPNVLWGILYTIPTLCIIGTFFAIFLTRTKSGALKMATFFHLPIQITFFIINFLVFILYAEFAKFHSNSKTNALLIQQIEYQNKHFRDLEESWNKIREIRHDMKNQLKTALYLYKKNSHKKLIHYLEDSLNQLSNIEEITHTGNLEIDALLNIKLNELSILGIKYTSDVVIPSDFSFPVEDIVIILGNLFDNAKDACEILPTSKRYIQFTMHFTQDSLFINMKNSYSGDFSLNTRKQNKMLHGLGLKNIQKAVAKHAGMMSYDTKDNVFSVDIILYALPITTL